MKWIIAILVLFLSLAGFAEDRAPSVSKKDQKMAEEEFRRAEDLRKQGKIEEALLAATSASQLVPGNSEYALTREMLKQQIVSDYLEKGNKLANAGDHEGSAAQFREALARDPNNSYVQQRLRDVTGTDENPEKTRIMQLLASVNNIDLQPAPGKKNIHAGPDMRSVYTQIGQAFGIEFIFDQSITNRQLRVDMEDVDFYTVTSFLGKITKTFWSPVQSKHAIVANDTQEMRTAYERMAQRTFYISNTSSATDLNDLTNVMRTIFDMKFVSVQQTQNTITVRAPRTQIEAMTSFIESIMDAKPEMILVIDEIEFDSDKARRYGLNLPTDFTVFNVYSEIRRVLGNDAQSVIDQLKKTGTIDPSKISPSALSNLQGSPLLQPFVFFGKGLGLTGIVTNPISGVLSETRSVSTNKEHATVRALDGEPANFRIGEKFPVVTANFSSVAVSARGQINTGNTPQFQFVDLGLTLKATPHYHADGDLKLDLELEVLALGALSFNSVPELTSRSFKGNITIREGETSVIAGAVSDQELRSTHGYPGVSQIPGARAVLNTNSSDRAHNEIMLLITPYVIRKPFHDRGASAFWNIK